ncbi:calpain-5-like isoform X1 [Penaeus monodon]|uniref:calpain-5-like isoform X1 n=1 Tax=Penaeus monodon TaxID=6687 RepID=UPI0018A79DA2|nr:calpain-5-like isoform X1 [Penaeus monodon]XP_037777128.1 calpain-5-like isoform X1 [Penaeus monodon]XP_037777129.1 calpain-5-like isoform X1 [Penaeus monodon]
MGLFSNITTFAGQNYGKLKKDCLNRGEKFSDPKFPPHDSSLFFSKQPPGVITWKRPHEIVDKPQLFVEGASANDVTQGQLGNCWFVAACASLAGVKELWHRVIPDYKDQEYGDLHPGIFHFRFWRFGEWLDVIIDDLLPTIEGELVFVHSREKKEFWCALLEKAYAKLHGSYEALEGGNLSDALVDLTSGVSAHLDLTVGGYTDDFEKRKQLFKMMVKEMNEHALMCCAITPHSHEETEMRTNVGLVKGHAYGITAVRKINIGDTGLFSIFKGAQKIRMVRLKNPWGEREWNGAFSDGKERSGFVYTTSELTKMYSRSPEWSKVSASEREKLGLTFEDDGEFWMTFDDFVEHFTDLSICFLINTKVFSLSKTWHETVFVDAWTIGIRGHNSDRAGGCPNHKDSFLRNPQYRFDIREESDDVIFQLMQKDTRDRKQEGIQNLVIGFHIMKVEENRKYRVHRIHESIATSDYIRTRAIFLREQLKQGRYVIIPTTFKPDETGEFIVRMFTSKDANSRELTLDQPRIRWYSCVKKPVLVTTITVKGAFNLEKQSAFGGEADAYCIIKCEGEVVRTPVEKGTSDPKWDTTAIFYRTKPGQPIVLEVWNSNLLMDGFIGRAEVVAPINPNVTQVELPLFGRRKEKTLEKQGKLVVQVYSDDDLTSI